MDLLLRHSPQAGTLRRLGVHDAMAAGMRSRLARSSVSIGAGAGYNPDEPRDWHGRWTTDGSTGPPPESRWTGGYGLYGGRLIRIQSAEEDEPGIGHNGAPGEDDELPEGEARPGFEPSGHTVGGLYFQDHPLLDGKPWPIVSHDLIKSVLAPQGRAIPTMQIYVPQSGYGPILVGSNSTTDFPPPPMGYDIMALKGTPQVTYSRGQETKHAPDSIEAALAMAMTNRYSEIFFNRSFSTLTGGMVKSPLRPDVVGIVRPEIKAIERYYPHEIPSPGQNMIKRGSQMPPHPGVARMTHDGQI
ncbi:MAG TPA: hypothetical protein VMU59_15945 [Caulobacteraceae bacterium]|nr:hypothetical protein [Caulobacteraceae bacterium]